MLGNLIGGFITILVGATLIPTIADQVWEVADSNRTNVTGSAATIVRLVTLFFALAILTSAIGVTAVGLRQAGLIGA